jgi:hypothetical protein
VQLRGDVQFAASGSVAEMAGVTREGMLRSCGYNARLARRINFVMYSLIRGELGS